MSTVLPQIEQSPARGQRRASLPYAAALMMVVAGYIAMHVWRPAPVFPLDDPYIMLHSAQVLHWGFDPNYVGVPALYGVTSAPFLALVYLLLFALPPLMALDAACWLGVAFYAVGLVRLARTFSLARVEGTLIVAMGLLASFVPFHLVNGLETAWALGCVTWTLALASGERKWWIGCAAFAGVTAAVRPEMLPFCGLVIAALVFEIYRAEGRREALAAAVRFAGVALVPILICAVWYYVATGTPFPLTGEAKRYFFSEAGWKWTTKMSAEGGWLLGFAASCGPLLIALPRRAGHPLAKALLAVICMFFVLAYLQFPHAVGMNWFRYPILFIPMMLWALCVGTRDASAEKRRKGVRLLWVCAVYCVCLSLPVCLYVYVEKCRQYNAGLPSLVAWCEQRLPSNARLLVMDAGYIAYGSHFRTIDFVGLKTPEAISLNRRYTWPTSGGGRGRAVAELARDSGGEYLVLLSDSGPPMLIPDQLRALGWRVDPLRTEGMYWVYKLTPPGR